MRYWHKANGEYIKGSDQQPQDAVGYLDHGPDHVDSVLNAAGDGWELKLTRLAVEKRSELKTACEAAITAGIQSDALGATYIYPTDRDSQANMQGQYSAAGDLGAAGAPYKFWCADTGGVWARRDHTAAQMQAVALAVREHVIAQQERYESKLAELQAAVDVADRAVVEGVAW